MSISIFVKRITCAALISFGSITLWPVADALAQFVPMPTGGPLPTSKDANDPNERKRFLEWARIAALGTVSPVQAEPGDFSKQWKGPDGREIRLVVKRPKVLPQAPVVTMAVVPEGEDARPAFNAAMEEVRAKSAARLVIPKGRYSFLTSAGSESGHAVIENVSDLTIDGRGASFVFALNQSGLYVSHSRRVAITGLTLDFSLHTTSLGSIEQRGGNNVLVIDPRFPVSDKDAVYYLSEFDSTSGQWVAGGQRVILDPGSRTPAIYAGNQTYTSTAFRTLKPGTSVTAFHYWYGAAAIRIKDQSGPRQNEDIVIDGVTIHTSPGYGIHAYGLRRGLAIVNSTIVAKPGSINPASTIYDGIHVIVGGGDIIVARNRIANQGDDALNLNNPVHPVVSISTDGRTLRMSKYSRFISAGDSLAFFDRSGRFLGQATVTVGPRALGGLDNEIVIDRAVPGLEPQAVARDLALISSRFDVSDNRIEDCKCHGLLVQIPNGIVENNVIRNTTANAIRVLTDVGNWNEGVGAFNVILRKNTIVNSGIDTARMVPWSAITVYGGARGGAAALPVNKDIEISDNTITGAKQGCVTVSSSIDVKVLRNACNSSNLHDSRQGSLTVLNASAVTLSGNHRSGKSTGDLRIDATADTLISAQPDY